MSPMARRSWSALVEVKTGDNELEADQLNNYLLAAREIGAEKVISISNEMGVAGAHPTPGLKVRSNSRITVDHLSWTELLAEAIQCKVHAGVDDPEQAWILDELIRYLEHPSSGALSINDMGGAWVEVREWRQGIDTTQVGCWCGGGRQQVGPAHAVPGDPPPVGNRRRGQSRYCRATSATRRPRLAHLANQLVEDGALSDRIRIAGAAGDVDITADLRARRLTATVEVAAPGDKRGRGSVSWLVRQISRTADPTLVIEAYAPHAKTPVAATLAQALNDPDCLVPEAKDINRFALTYRAEMGRARKTGGRKPGFIDTVISVVDRIYVEVLQEITPWTPQAPQVKRVERNDSEPQPSKNSENEPTRTESEQPGELKRVDTSLPRTTRRLAFDREQRVRSRRRGPSNDGASRPTLTLPRVPVWL